MEEARCLKVKPRERAFKQFKSPVLNVLRLSDFMTTAQEGGKVVSLTHLPHLPQGNSPGTHFC